MTNPQQKRDEDDLGGGQDGAGAGGGGDDGGVHGGGHARIKERLALVTHGAVQGDGEDGFDERGVVVAGKEGPHHVVGVWGVEDPEDRTVGGECLNGGENGDEEGEPGDGGTK